MGKEQQVQRPLGYKEDSMSKSVCVCVCDYIIIEVIKGQTMWGPIDCSGTLHFIFRRKAIARF